MLSAPPAAEVARNAADVARADVVRKLRRVVDEDVSDMDVPPWWEMRIPFPAW
jgi:hypothetical protein